MRIQLLIVSAAAICFGAVAISHAQVDSGGAYTRNNPVNYTDPIGYITAMKADGVSSFKPTPRR
jgi:hypothetical protein